MITVRDLLFSEEQSPFSVLAGESGLDKDIKAISFIDAPSSIEWLRGNEIILTTAFLYQADEAALYRFISALIRKNVTGVGLKIGRFVKELPDAITELADLNGFPIFSLPYEMVWSEVMERFYLMDRHLAVDDGFFSIASSALLRQMERNGGDATANRRAFVEYIKIPAAIVDNQYHPYVTNANPNFVPIQKYCAVMAEQPESRPIYRVRLTRMGEFWIGEAVLSETERLILVSEKKLLNSYEIERLCITYNSVRKRSWLHASKTSLIHYFMEGIATGATESELAGVVKYLELGDGNYFRIVIAEGCAAEQACAELKSALGKNPLAKKVVLYQADVQVQEKTETILLVSVPNKYLSNAGVDIVLRRAVSNIGTELGCIFYCGGTAKKVEKIRRSYLQAKKSEEYSAVLQCKNRVVFYQEFSVLDKLSKEECDFREIELLNEKIVSFDAIKTLEAFLEYNSVRVAAAANFIHENTMRYRVGKIKDILCCDFSDSITKLNFLLKIKLWRIVQAERDKQACAAETD